MRATLEQLKAMDNGQLLHLWAGSQFPFDMAKGCEACLTTHRDTGSGACKIAEHEGIKAISRERLGPWANICEPDFFVNHIEELYALRLFYDSLYPPSVEPNDEAGLPMAVETNDRKENPVCS